MKLLSNIV